MRGVLGFVNQIAVRTNETEVEVGAQIAAALARWAEHECEGIVIDARDGVVTLTGTVRSLAEKRAACQAAWSAPGVGQVVNHLIVA